MKGLLKKLTAIAMTVIVFSGSNTFSLKNLQVVRAAETSPKTFVFPDDIKLNPLTDLSETEPWTGNYVYYGKDFDNNDLKWKILQVNRTNWAATNDTTIGQDNNKSGLLIWADQLKRNANFIKMQFHDAANIMNINIANNNYYEGTVVGTGNNRGTLLWAWLNSYTCNVNDNKKIAEEGFLNSCISEKERTAIGTTYIKAGSTSGDKVFLLNSNIIGMENGVAYGFVNDESRKTNNQFWLYDDISYRNRKSYQSIVTSTGTISTVSDDNGAAIDNTETVVCPAMHLNSEDILFLSDVNNGKSNAEATMSVEQTNQHKNNYKATIIDENLSLTLQSGLSTIETVRQGTITVNVSEINGSPNRLSYLITSEDDSEIIAYGYNDAVSTGEIEFQMPDNIEPGTYKIKFFAENYNEGNATDYASEFTEDISLTITADPEILIQPQNQTADYKDDITLSLYAGANPQGELNYQWYKGEPGSGTQVTNQTSNYMLLEDVSVSDSGNYYCEVTNTYNSIPYVTNSDVVTVTVMPRLIETITNVTIPDAKKYDYGEKEFAELFIESADILDKDKGKVSIKCKVKMPSVNKAGEFNDATVTVDKVNNENYEYTGGEIENQKYRVLENVKDIAGIEIIQPPKLEYEHGEKIDLSNMKLSVKYNDGTSEEIDYDEYVFKQHNLTTNYYSGQNVKVEDNTKCIEIIKNSEALAALELKVSKSKPKINLEIEPSYLVGGGNAKLILTLTNPNDETFTENLPEVETLVLNHNGIGVSKHAWEGKDGKYEMKISIPNETQKIKFTCSTTGNDCYETSDESSVELVVRETIDYFDHGGNSGGGGSASEESKELPVIMSDFYTLQDVKIPELIKNKKPIKGYKDGSFKPDDKITRAEAASILYSLIYNGIRVDMTAIEKYSDMDLNHWASSAIAYLTQIGIMQGYEGKFRPDDEISRAEMSQVLFNTLLSYQDDKTKKLKLGNKKIELSDSENNVMADAIRHLTSNGIINGYEDGTFRPNESITRAEVVCLIVKAFDIPIKNDVISRFSDVANSHWAYKFIVSLCE